VTPRYWELRERGPRRLFLAACGCTGGGACGCGRMCGCVCCGSARKKPTSAQCGGPGCVGPAAAGKSSRVTSCGCCSCRGGDGVASLSPSADAELLRMLNSSTARGGGVELDPFSACAADASDVPESLLAVDAGISGATSDTFRSSSISLVIVVVAKIPNRGSTPRDSCWTKQQLRTPSKTTLPQHQKPSDNDLSRLSQSDCRWSVQFSGRRTRGGIDRGRRVPSRSRGTFILHTAGRAASSLPIFDDHPARNRSYSRFTNRAMNPQLASSTQGVG
jgi:hypothetical protein